MRVPLLMLLCALLGCPPAARTDPPTAAVARGEFTVGLDLVGELAAVRTTPLIVPDIGLGAQVTFIAPEGQRVAAGDVVVELDRSDLGRHLQQARNDQEIARVRIKQQEAQLELRLADLRATVERAELGLKGAQMRVTDSEAVPRVERDAARLDVQSATLALDQARAALETARLQGEAQLELLGIQARQGQELLARTEAQLAATTLRATVGGVVVHTEAPEGRPVGQGFLVYPGTRVVELADPAAVQVVAWAHELDAAKLAAGQAVSLALDASPGRAFAGTVESVGDMAVNRGVAGPGKRLQVVIALVELDPAMRPGMSVRARVEVERAADVLTVPREAVFARPGGDCVLRRSGRGWEAVAVERGAADASRVVVRGALAAGEQVALVDPEAPAAGAGAQGAAAGGSGT